MTYGQARGFSFKFIIMQVTSIPIVCVETGRIYRSIRCASKEMDIDSKSIRRVVDNPKSKSCGYHWKRI